MAAGAREEAEEDGEGALRNGEVREREEASVEGERGERRRVREEEVGEERREEGGAGREEREEERWGGRRVGEEEAREVGDGRGKEWRGEAAGGGGGVKCKIATTVGLRSDVSYSWIARLHRNHDCIGYVSMQSIMHATKQI